MKERLRLLSLAYSNSVAVRLTDNFGWWWRVFFCCGGCGVLQGILTNADEKTWFAAGRFVVISVVRLDIFRWLFRRLKCADIFGLFFERR
jgi:hypothetical protein